MLIGYRVSRIDTDFNVLDAQGLHMRSWLQQVMQCSMQQEALPLGQRRGHHPHLGAHRQWFSDYARTSIRKILLVENRTAPRASGHGACAARLGSVLDMN